MYPSHKRKRGNLREVANPFRQIDCLAMALSKSFDKLVDTMLDDGLEFFDRVRAERAVPGLPPLRVLGR